MDEEKIEELVEQEVEEVIEEKTNDAVETQGKGLERIIEEKIEEKYRKAGGSLVNLDEKKISRRGFLKALGLGTGGLALSSIASSASLLSGTTINGNTA
ncbi:MAG: twin-arginine translocation signal domain-containing protein [Candidatus Nanohaloarchaea archaeon]